MDFDLVTDPRNPFKRTGLSKEVLSIIQYVIDAKEATGLDFVITSTTDHAVNTSAGYPSRHRMQGTDGEGLGVDGRLRTTGTTKDLHRAFFDIFVPFEKKLHELIYAYSPWNIKAGKRVSPYAVSSHKDHVHLSVNKGTFLTAAQPTQEPSQEEDMTPALAAKPGEDRLDAFLVGTDNAVWWNTSIGASWTGWRSIKGTVISGVDAEWRGNALVVVAKGTDGACWHNYGDGVNWAGWESLGGKIA